MSEDEIREKIEQDIRGMFKLEATRNDLNYALSGVERGEMTIQDYEDDLSVAISNWFIKDLLPKYSQRISLETRIDEAQYIQEKYVSSGSGYCDEIGPDDIPTRISQLKSQLQSLDQSTHAKEKK